MLLVCGFVLMAGGVLFGEDAPPLEKRVKQLEDLVRQQAQLLQTQQAQLTDQQAQLATQKQELETQKKKLSEKEAELDNLRTADAPVRGGPASNLLQREPAPPGPESLETTWRNSLSFRSRERDLRLRIGGRIVNDWTELNEDERLSDVLGKQEYTTLIRSARITFSGELPHHVIFAADYEFADDYVEMDVRGNLRSLYIGITDLPYLGTWRVGRFNEPFSLEDLTDPLFQTFTENSLPEAVIPGARGVLSRSVGTMLNNSALNDRMTWAVGYFRDALRFVRTDEDDGGSDRLYSNMAVERGQNEGARANWGVTARLTGLPWYEDGGRKLIHLGVAYAYRSNWDRQAHFLSRPEVRAAPYYSVVEIDSAGTHHFNAELALVHGRFSLQSQYIGAVVKNEPSILRDRLMERLHPFFFPGGGYVQVGDRRYNYIPSLEHEDAFFQSFYVFGSAFLTGESRKYLKRYGVFGRVRPKRNFLDGQGGLGAFELAARYSYLDLDGGIDEMTVAYHDVMDNRYYGGPILLTGGKMHAITGGLNWYLSPNVRTMLNYTYTMLDGGSSMGDQDLDQTGRLVRPDGELHSFTLRFQLDF
jgi:phosphate-selective porin OprO/OprP